MQFPYIGLENHPDGITNFNAILLANWQSLADAFNPATGLTASQSGTTVTASGDVFTADDVGAVIRYADETTDTIASYTSATQVEVGTSRTVGSQAFELYRAGESLSEAVARAMVKRPQMVAADDGKVPIWDDTLKRFVMGTVEVGGDESDVSDGSDTSAGGGQDANGNLFTNSANISPGAPADMTNGLYMVAGVAPTSNPADMFMAWVADLDGGAGQAALHMESEDGVQHVFGTYVGINMITGMAAELHVNGDVLADTYETNDSAIQVLDTFTGAITSNDLAFPDDANVITVPAGTVNTVSNVRAGAVYYLVALGAVTFTDSATINCRGASNIVLAANEPAIAIGLGPSSISLL